MPNVPRSLTLILLRRTGRRERPQGPNVNTYARNPASLEDSVRKWRRRGAPTTSRIIPERSKRAISSVPTSIPRASPMGFPSSSTETDARPDGPGCMTRFTSPPTELAPDDDKDRHRCVSNLNEHFPTRGPPEPSMGRHPCYLPRCQRRKHVFRASDGSSDRRRCGITVVHWLNLGGEKGFAAKCAAGFVDGPRRCSRQCDLGRPGIAATPMTFSGRENEARLSLR